MVPKIVSHARQSVHGLQAGLSNVNIVLVLHSFDESFATLEVHHPNEQLTLSVAPKVIASLPERATREGSESVSRFQLLNEPVYVSICQPQFSPIWNRDQKFR